MYIESDAKCILVVEKEGIYTRLNEDKFFEKYPCIIVTGKGFPDVATRRWVHRLQHLLEIPAFGLCDCNPYGISVLNTYQYEQGVQIEKAKLKKLHQDLLFPDNIEDSDDDDNDDIYSNANNRRSQQKSKKKPLELQWIGLRPSQIEELGLPSTIFQQLTTLDKKRLETLLDDDHPFCQHGWNPTQRRKELMAMNQYKVELEALHWKGMDFLSQFVLDIIRAQEEVEDNANLEADNGDGVKASNYII